MSKKKKKSVDTEKTAVQADLADLIDAAKSSLFELDSSYSFVEDEKKSDVQVTTEGDLIQEIEKDSELTDSKFDDEFSVRAETKFETESDELIEARLEAEVSELVEAKLEGDSGKLAEASLEGNSTELVKVNPETVPTDELSFAEEVFSELEVGNEAELLGETTESQDDFNLLATAFQEQEIEPAVPGPSLEGTELESFESAQIEELEFITEDQLQSVVESILFATDRPVSMATIKQVFVGTNVTNARIKATIEALKSYYASSKSGVTLEDIGSGFQLRTKLDNMEFLRRSLKARPFKLSGPALEVLAIVAYKQPIIKSEIDEIRGVESGHLLRALMEKNLCTFGGKSDLPGKPMLYETTRKFLEIFSLRNLKELPTLSQIDELIPEGIGDEADEKPKLHDITDGLAHHVGTTYSEGEEELNKITGQLEEIQTSTDFFEQEKQRQREQKDAEKAQNIRDAQAVGETVSSRDANWLKRYDEQKLAAENPDVAAAASTHEEDTFKPDSVIASDDEFDELSMALDAIGEEESLIDPEVLEANDIADIEA
jgi:segregation and condensation protein B